MFNQKKNIGRIYKVINHLILINIFSLLVLCISGRLCAVAAETGKQMMTKIENVLKVDLKGLPDIILSRTGEFVAYCADVHVGDAQIERNQVGLYSIPQKRLLWSKEMPEGIRLTAIQFSERDHAVICAYLSKKVKKEDTGKYSSGFYIFNSTGQLERDVVVSAVNPQTTLTWLAVPIFVDMQHIVTILPDHDSAKAIQIFTRKGDLLKTILTADVGSIGIVVVSPDGTYMTLDTPKGIVAMNMSGEKLWTFDARLTGYSQSVFTKNAKYLIVHGGNWLADCKWQMDSWRKTGRSENRFAYTKQVNGYAILDRWGNPVWGYANIGISGPLQGPATQEDTRIGDFNIKEYRIGGEKQSVTLLSWSGRYRKIFLLGDEYVSTTVSNGGNDDNYPRVIYLPDALSDRERSALSANGRNIVIAKPIKQVKGVIEKESIELYSYTGKKMASTEILIGTPKPDGSVPNFIWNISISDDGQYIALLDGSTLSVFEVSNN